MKRLLFLLYISIHCTLNLFAQEFTYGDSWDRQGYNLKTQSPQNITLIYSIRAFTMDDMEVRGEAMKHLRLADHFLPGDEGSPDLPGSGRYVAVPQGASPVLHIKSVRKEVYKDVNISPAPRIPKETEDGPLDYTRNSRIYNSNAFYPAEPIKLSEMTQVRGIDAVILGITPFQYNPVTKELIVYRDIEVEIEFTGGNGQFGDERLRSRWWDPIMEDIFINSNSIPKVDYSRRFIDNTRGTGYEYLIICPDDPAFISWADSIRVFRTKQGIHTGVVTTTELGGNTTAAIENYIDNAYETWDIPPAAVLLIGDYGTSGNTIVSPIWSSYCVSDHIYADVSGDDEEEIIFARMTARDEAELEVMVRKAIDYERNPPTNPDFYNHPITALGWQTERWFQICSEAVGGYFRNIHGKEPVRINAVYGGNPAVDPWSSATNTETVLNIFGPNGLGYIPASPTELGGWTGGTATMVNNAMNTGSFLLQHRDHGFEFGWGEPDYQNDHINGLTNTDLSFIFSINCLTGKYNHSQESFAEKFHRYTYNGQPAGALGLLAASETSYSFVNDTYVWGVFDNMFPDFMPQFGTTPESRGMRPAFGNAAGKFFLKYSSWPYNTTNKEVTYNLFHHHGDAFTCLYSEVPQDLTIVHDPVQLAGLPEFMVQADEGALIALSVDGELIGVGTGTGTPLSIPIIAQVPPAMIDLVISKENYYRYETRIQTIPPEGPYIIVDSFIINDTLGNSNGQLDYGETVSLDITLKNVGSEIAEDVLITLKTGNQFITFHSDSAWAGSILPDETITIEGAFAFTVSNSIPNGYYILFILEASDSSKSWVSHLTIRASAPVIEFAEFSISDIEGNNNGRLDPGETAELSVVIKNKGSADAYNIYGFLSSNDPFITVESDSAFYGYTPFHSLSTQTYIISAQPATPSGYQANFSIDLVGDMDIYSHGEFALTVGLFPVLVLDLDLNQNSGNKIKTAIDDWRVFAEYSKTIPDDISHYRTIFLCLGTYTNNFVLKEPDVGPFIEFLNGGGNMYMEGADTWYWDQVYNPTTLHPMFNIQGVSDGTNDLGTIHGLSGTFTEGYSFSFSGDNNYIDHIAPVSPAFTIFSNLLPVYDVAVAYDAGKYKTIGSSFEFGGLDDSEKNTRKDLIMTYMEFFSMNPITEAPSMPEGDTSICGTDVPSSYTIQPIEGVDYYIWTMVPAGAGTMEGWGTEVIIQWASGFQGTVNLSVCGMNEVGMGPDSPILEIDVHEIPTAAMSLSSTTICAGDTVYMNINLTGTAPWHIELSVGGTEMFLDSDLPVIDSIPLLPTTDTEVVMLSVIDFTGCETSGFEPLAIQVFPTPVIPTKPTGTENVDLFLYPQTTYSTTGDPDTDNYLWSIDPETAGNLIVEGAGQEPYCIVEWSPDFTGQASIMVKGINECGESDHSEALTVTVSNTFGIPDPLTGIGIAIYPNPNNGTFRLELSAITPVDLSMSILSATGAIIWGPFTTELDRKITLPVNLEYVSEGIYLLKIETSAGTLIRKMMIRN